MKSWKEKTDGERGREKGVIREKEGWKDDGMAEGETEVKLIDGARAGRRIMSNGGRKRESIESSFPLHITSPFISPSFLFHYFSCLPLSSLLFCSLMSYIFHSSSPSFFSFSVISLLFYFPLLSFTSFLCLYPSLLFFFHGLSVFLSSLVISFFSLFPLSFSFFLLLTITALHIAATCSKMHRSLLPKTKENR